MGVVMQVHLPCDPPRSTAQTKRLATVGGKVRVFRSKAHDEALSTLTALLLPHQPAKPVEGAVSLDIEVTWKHPTSIRKSLKDERLWKPTKPDLDNWLKGLIDVLVTLRFIEDDSKVVELTARKLSGPKPGIRITIAKQTEETCLT